MGTPTATARLLQSKFFTPAFNTAIFDGPLRMYFSQSQEAEALKVYFRFQEKFKAHLKTNAEPLGTVFLMLYPNHETFDHSFEVAQDWAMEKLGEDLVVGLRGAHRDDLFDQIADKLQPMFEAGSFDFA